jgi:RecJ-like exonuclease
MKRLIQCPVCKGLGYTGSTEMHMTENGPEDTTELCPRCRGKCEVEIAAKPEKHVEAMPICGSATYSIFLPE